jgi:hypothetical protein
MIDRITAAVLCFALAGTVAAQDKKPPAPAGKPAAEAKAPEVFVIAKTGDKFEVMAKSEVEAKKKKAAEDFKSTKEAWEKDKKAAEAAHKKLDKPEPKEPQGIEVKPGEYPTKDAAEAELKKMQADKAKKPEPGKKDPAPAGKKGH